MNLFPAFFRLEGAHVVIFGTEAEAVRKVRLMAKTPAEIRLVAETLSPAMQAEFGARLAHHTPDEARGALTGAAFAIVALVDEADGPALPLRMDARRPPVAPSWRC